MSFQPETTDPFAGGKAKSTVLDPLAGVPESDRADIEAAHELEALHSAMNARRRQEDDRFRRATDSEYWLAVCFTDRASKEAFLAAIPKDVAWLGDKYLDGHDLARRLGIDLESDSDA